MKRLLLLTVTLLSLSTLPELAQAGNVFFDFSFVNLVPVVPVVPMDEYVVVERHKVYRPHYRYRRPKVRYYYYEDEPCYHYQPVEYYDYYDY